MADLLISFSDRDFAAIAAAFRSAYGGQYPDVSEHDFVAMKTVDLIRGVASQVPEAAVSVDSQDQTAIAERAFNNRQMVATVEWMYSCGTPLSDAARDAIGLPSFHVGGTGPESVGVTQPSVDLAAIVADAPVEAGALATPIRSDGAALAEMPNSDLRIPVSASSAPETMARIKAAYEAFHAVLAEPENPA